jgi:heptosyltransferase-2
MPKKRCKILIIKVGYSETLDPEISTVTSYGDVLRSTVLLNEFKDDHVTWLVDENAFPILRNNPYIDRILIYNLTSVLQLQSEQFDTVINLEKVPGLCALADHVKAWRRYGFRFDPKTGSAEAYDGSQSTLKVCHSENKKKKNRRYWQQHLFDMIGKKWTNEEYVFGYKPASHETYDFGFNYMVGTKWPSKGWFDTGWKELESHLCKNYSVSWQEGLNNIEEYFEWINKCRVLITNDSFGLHIALALKKKVIALFSSTTSYETYLYGHGIAMFREHACEFQPCYEPKCIKEAKCCEVSVDNVYKAAIKIMENKITSSPVNACFMRPEAALKSQMRQRIEEPCCSAAII